MTEKTLTMLGPYILMSRDKPEERKTPGGVVLPAKTGDTTSWGTAVQVGSDAATQVQVGDRLLVGRYAGNDVKMGEDTLVVVRLEDVYGVERPMSAGASAAAPKSING